MTDQVLEFEIIYSNTGGSAAHNVTMTAPVPAQTMVSFPNSSATCPYSGGYDAGFTALTCVLGNAGTVGTADSLGFRRSTYTAMVTAPLNFCGTVQAGASVVTDETGTTSATPLDIDINGAPLCLQ